MLSSWYSTNAYSVNLRRACRRKASETSVKTYRTHVLLSTGTTLDAVPPVPAPTSSTCRGKPGRSAATAAPTASTTHPL
eukprot:5924990-Prymnesium_polylepis.1